MLLNLQITKEHLEAVTGGVLQNFAMLTGKDLCWSLFLIKLQAFRPATLLKRDSDIGVYSVYSALDIFENTYFDEYLRTAELIC